MYTFTEIGSQKLLLLVANANFMIFKELFPSKNLPSIYYFLILQPIKHKITNEF